MNEEDLKRVFQDVVVASSPPPSMDPGRALDVARKARSKRRSSVVGAVVAVLVVGIGIGSAFALNPKGAQEYVMGAGPSSSSRAPMPDTQWGDQWPVGQNDRTATNGPQADRGVEVMEALKALAQANGYETPALKYKDPAYQNGEMLRNQAQISTNKGEKPEVWEYTAYVPVRKNGKVGMLLAEVSMPNPKDPADLCALAKRFWGMTNSDCKLRDVEGKQVAQASASSPEAVDRGLTTWMVYRAPNGWTVTIGQGATYSGGGYPALDSSPLGMFEQEHAVVDPRFLVGS